MNKKKITIIMLLIIFAVSIFTACGSSVNDESQSDYDTSEKSYDLEKPSEDNGFTNYYEVEDQYGGVLISSSEDFDSWLEEQKIIKNGYISVEVDDFDKAYSKMTSMINSHGHVQSESIKTNTEYVNNKPVKVKRGSIVIRIVSEEFDNFLNSFGDIGEVEDMNRGTENITDQYMDKEARIRLYQNEQARLEEFLAKEDNPETVFKYQERLTEILYNIEKLQGQLNSWDNLVKFSTVTVYMSEKVKGLDTNPRDDSFFEKVWKTLKTSFEFCESLVIFLIGAIPVLIILGLFVLLIIVIIKKIKGEKNIKHDNNRK